MMMDYDNIQEQIKRLMVKFPGRDIRRYGILAHGKVYPHMKAAAEALDVSYDKMRRLVFNKELTEYSYLDQFNKKEQEDAS